MSKAAQHPTFNWRQRMTPEDARKLLEQLAAQSARAVVVCLRPDQLDWARLPAAITVQRAQCADCQVDVVWTPRSSPTEPLKVCESCADARIARDRAEGLVPLETMYVGPESTPPPAPEGRSDEEQD